MVCISVQWLARLAAALLQSGMLQAWLAKLYRQQLAQRQDRLLIAQQQAAEELALQVRFRLARLVLSIMICLASRTS